MNIGKMNERPNYLDMSLDDVIRDMAARKQNQESENNGISPLMREDDQPLGSDIPSMASADPNPNYADMSLDDVVREKIARNEIQTDIGRPGGRIRSNFIPVSPNDRSNYIRAMAKKKLKMAQRTQHELRQKVMNCRSFTNLDLRWKLLAQLIENVKNKYGNHLGRYQPYPDFSAHQRASNKAQIAIDGAIENGRNFIRPEVRKKNLEKFKQVAGRLPYWMTEDAEPTSNQRSTIPELVVAETPEESHDIEIDSPPPLVYKPPVSSADNMEIPMQYVPVAPRGITKIPPGLRDFAITFATKKEPVPPKFRGSINAAAESGEAFQSFAPVLGIPKLPISIRDLDKVRKGLGRASSANDVSNGTQAIKITGDRSRNLETILVTVENSDSEPKIRTLNERFSTLSTP